MSDARERFRASLAMDADKWRDGTPYDLDAFDAMSAAQRQSEASSLAARGKLDWRDVDVIERLDSPEFRDRLSRAALQQDDHGGAAALAAVARHGWTAEWEARLIGQFEAARLMETSLYRLFELTESHPTTGLRAALERLAFEGKPETRYAFAAFLLYLHGHADTWYGLEAEHRPHLLRLSGSPEEQMAARDWLKARLKAPLRTDRA